MSSRYQPVKTNRVPWTDEMALITIVKAADADGYETTSETARSIFCTFIQGVSRTEFYEAMKAGISLSAQAEIWENDFEGEEFCEFDSKRFKIIRAFPTGRGTVELNLQEVIR